VDRFWAGIAALVTGRRSVWAVLALAVAASGLLIGLAPGLKVSDDPTAGLPASAPSTTVAQLQEQLPSGQLNPALVVYSRPGGTLTDADLAAVTAQMKVYRAALAEAGRTPREYPLTRECYIGASHATAFEECRTALHYKYSAYASWGLGRQAHDLESFGMPFEQFVRDRFIIGDKASVREEVARYREELGVDHVIMRVQWPGLPQERVLHSIRSLGEIFA